MAKTNASVEILYVSGSSLDQKGKRVLVREKSCENWIFPADRISETDRRILGLTEQDQQHIEVFFQEKGDPDVYTI